MGRWGLVFGHRIATAAVQITFCGLCIRALARWVDWVVHLYLRDGRWRQHGGGGRDSSDHLYARDPGGLDFALGLGARHDTGRGAALMRVVFVCLGNICRSPAAEGVMRKLAPELTLDSAGTGGWHVGDPPYRPMQEAAARRGIALGDLRARQFSRADFTDFDLIVAMDGQNKADIERLRPSGNTTPVRLTAETDVRDPYYTRDFDGALDIIEAAAKRLLADISRMRDR